MMLSGVAIMPGYFFKIIAICMYLATVVSSKSKCVTLARYGLKTAECEERDLTSIPGDLERDTKVLCFNDNLLANLVSDQFSQYVALQQVYLTRNRIESISPHAFRGLGNLQILDLEGNKLTQLPVSSFQHIGSLKTLSFQSNPIRHLDKDDLKQLSMIEEINFQNCWLESVHPQAFRGLDTLQVINLVNNELQTLNADMEIYLPKNLKTFRLYRNKWKCDCKLRWLKKWLVNTRINWDFTSSDTPSCSGPELITGISWKILEPKQFACPAHILTNGNTTIQLHLGSNTTIMCIVQGDPEPEITWLKSSREIKDTRKRFSTDKYGEATIQSSITLSKITTQHAGDYKCVAKNSAGRSEVTYKLWIAGHTDEPSTGQSKMSLTLEATLGIVLGVAIFVVLLVILLVYAFRRRDRKRHAYKVRDYKKAPNGKKEKRKRQDIDKHEEEPYDSKDNDKVLVTTELLCDKKEETLKQDKLETDKKVNENLYNDIREIKAKENQFKMKIFQEYDPHDEEKTIDLDTVPPVVNHRVSGVISPDKVKGKTEGVEEREVTPDLLKTDNSSRPEPQLQQPNHISQTYQKKAKENPYAKPSELKPASTPKTSPSPTPSNGPSGVVKTLIDPDKNKSPQTTVSNKAKSDDLLSKPSETSQTLQPRKSRDSSPCRNPVCLRGHSPKSPTPEQSAHIPSQASPSPKPIIKNMRPHGGTQMFDSANTEPSKAKDKHVDGHRTLPHRPVGQYGSPSRGLTKPTVTFSTPSSAISPRHSRHSPIPPKSGSSSPSSPMAQVIQQYESSPSRTLPRNPVAPRCISGVQPIPISSTLGPSHRPGPRGPCLHGIVGKDGTRSLDSGEMTTLRPHRTYGTPIGASLDDILSPPFGIGVDKHRAIFKQSPRLPKPGDKDEFGTAV